MPNELIDLILNGGTVALLVFILVEGAKRFDAITVALEKKNEQIMSILRERLDDDDTPVKKKPNI